MSVWNAFSIAIHGKSERFVWFEEFSDNLNSSFETDKQTTFLETYKLKKSLNLLKTHCYVVLMIFRKKITKSLLNMNILKYQIVR